MTIHARLAAGNSGRAFGGAALDALLRAAAAHAPPGAVPHSLHGHFLQPARTDVDVELSTRVLRASHSFTTVAAQAEQRGLLVATATASFHVPRPSLEHAVREPVVAWEPAGAPPARGGPIPDVSAPSRAPIDLREAPGMSGVDGRPVLRYWVRHRDMASDGRTSALDQAAALAWASDLCLTRVADVEHEDCPGVRQAASLDHAMWFHRAPTPGAWLLYEVSSPSYVAELALSVGRFFDRDGHLVASVAQESLLRRR